MSFKKCSKCGAERTCKHSWCHACQRVANKQYQQDNPDWRLFDSARTRARKKGMEFSITREDVVIPDRCPLLDIELVWDVNKPHADNKPSLDRKDSSKGYTPDNVWVVSWLANKIMSSATPEQIKLLASNL